MAIWYCPNDAPVVKHTAVQQNWYESERGWGRRPAGYTLHLTVEDATAYVEKFARVQHERFLADGGSGVPECYTAPEGSPKPITVDAATYEVLKLAAPAPLWRH